jgi:truncated hemoglobin YjbI
MNLFEKYGGQNFWHGFLNDFYKKIVVSHVIRHHFRDKDVSHIKEMLLGLLEVILISYTHCAEDAMVDSHRHLDIKSDEFSEWVNIFRQTLKEYSVIDEDVIYIVNILTHYRPFIVTDTD